MKQIGVYNSFWHDSCDTYVHAQTHNVTLFTRTSVFALLADIPSAHQFAPTYVFSHLRHLSMLKVPTKAGPTHTYTLTQQKTLSTNLTVLSLILNGPWRISVSREGRIYPTEVLIGADKLNGLECFTVNRPSPTSLESLNLFNDFTLLKEMILLQGSEMTFFLFPLYFSDLRRDPSLDSERQAFFDQDSERTLSYSTGANCCIVTESRLPVG